MAIQKLQRRHTHTNWYVYLRPILPFSMFPFPDKFRFKGIFQGFTGPISETYDSGSRVLDSRWRVSEFSACKHFKQETLRRSDHRFMCFVVTCCHRIEPHLNQDQWHDHRWLSPPAASRAACPSLAALPARPVTHDPSQPTPITGAPSWTSGMVTKYMYIYITATAMILQQ